jgi:hypothetical protein
MPQINMEAQHRLGRDEAARRLREKFDHVRSRYGDQVNGLQESWTDHTLSFGFKAMGFAVSGTVLVEDALVRLRANLPLAAMFFKGSIESKIREELGGLLA